MYLLHLLVTKVSYFCLIFQNISLKVHLKNTLDNPKVDVTYGQQLNNSQSN